MMIVDLIDEVDFKEKMLGIGAPLKDCQTLADISEALLTWLDENPESLANVKTACEELEATGATILPDVHDVIKQLLQK
ncbi:hypothetical protein MAQ5080_00636 [Marinomonas aquimarina]|uniref:Uncharacterized protein n=1 Tax=Marinomonas aquimarina TaxID=295068 RepID=A0A1A8T6B0_9GAMM|nr:hypothetical protein [Marinomonas aquimarina]SBS26843.1 hypothetical protein MAQ5080_00636 [Marinomonas aquimarina]